MNTYITITKSTQRSKEATVEAEQFKLKTRKYKPHAHTDIQQDIEHNDQTHQVTNS